MGYVKFNRALHRQHRKKGTTDLIELVDIDESNGWLMGKMEDDEQNDDDDLVFIRDDLTFNVVCKASEAYEPIHLTRASKAKATTDGSGPSRKGDGPMLGDIDTIDLDFYFRGNLCVESSSCPPLQIQIHVEGFSKGLYRDNNVDLGTWSNNSHARILPP
ncbi:hypothetical protein E3N88_33205 [Mikania micrantha]|uniref:Uncharacterized protein n=1 Tax=Mikania micrantha TaxID=192012 RepID=A0A5N6MAL4_9ASTR|nr:hypothetical protein E3N88_33205 [Mikania micrantha]